MDNVLYQMAQYATKQEINQLIDAEINLSTSYDNTANSLGESPKQRFESLLMESQEIGRQYAEGIERPDATNALYNEDKYWSEYTHTAQGLQRDQYTNPYVVPTQHTNLIPKTTHTSPHLYDNNYTQNRGTNTTQSIPGSESYTTDSRWNAFKGVHVPTVGDNKITGDMILRGMGIENPVALKTSGFHLEPVSTPPPSLESNLRSPDSTLETPREILVEQTDPMKIIAIQMKTYTMSMGAGITNSTFKTTEANLDQLSKGE